MPLIAMTREMGSLGMDVAKVLESELKVPLIYHEIIDHLADKMRLRKSHVIRLLGGKANLFERLTADKTSMSIYTDDEVLSLASKGAIMRGWGAAQLLRPVKHALCVRICAPFELRVQRMMSRLNTDDRHKVEEEIRASDEAQAAIVKRHFDKDWQDPACYDLSLNTERISIEECAAKIARLARNGLFAETEESRSALRALTVQARIRAALHADSETRRIRSVSVEAREGNQLHLVGLVDTREQRKAVDRVIGGLRDIGAITNELRVAADVRRPMGE